MLIDTHVHLALDGINFQAARRRHATPNRDLIRDVLLTYKQMGITALRDGGDNLHVSLLAREIAAEEGMIVRTPGYAFYKKGAYGSFLGRPLTGIDDFKQEFQQLLLLKPDHIKIILTGLLNFHVFGKIEGIHFTFDELYYMIQSAKNRSLPVMVHANSAEAVEMAVLAGADTIEHGYYLEEDQLSLMREKGTIWVPTLAPLGNLLTGLYDRYREQAPVIREIFTHQQTMIQKAFLRGVKIAAGSDAGSYAVIHGKGYFDEVAYLEQAGLHQDEVFAMCSQNGMEALGIT